MKIKIKANKKEDLIKIYNDIYRNPGKLRDVDALYRWILDLLHPRPGQTLLDIGCGEGVLVYQAIERGLVAWGVDISEEAIKLARSNNYLGFLVCDGEHLPFQDNYFDYVTNIGSLEHFLDPIKGIIEMKRVVKPEGLIVILLPNSYYIGDIIWHVWRTGYGPHHKQPLERFGTFGEWRDMIEGCELYVERAFKYNFMFPKSRKDFLYYLARPRKLIYLLIAPIIPFNLSYSFLFLCKKR